MTPSTSLFTTLLCVPLALGLAGCSGDKSATTDNSPSRIMAPSPTNQPEGAVADLGKVECKADAKGVWSFNATLTNKGTTKASYTVLVAIVTKAGSTVVGSKQTDVELAPGKSAPVKLADIATTKKSADHLCTRNVTVKRGD